MSTHTILILFLRVYLSDNSDFPLIEKLTDSSADGFTIYNKMWEMVGFALLKSKHIDCRWRHLKGRKGKSIYKNYPLRALFRNMNLTRPNQLDYQIVQKLHEYAVKCLTPSDQWNSSSAPAWIDKVQCSKCFVPCIQCWVMNPPKLARFETYLFGGKWGTPTQENKSNPIQIFRQVAEADDGTSTKWQRQRSLLRGLTEMMKQFQTTPPETIQPDPDTVMRYTTNASL